MALGRTKIGRRQRAAAPEAQPEPAAPDHELESYLAALSPEDSVETTGTGQRFGGSQVYQLRLPLMANEQLKEMAARQGTSPGALARDLVLHHLQSMGSDPAPAAAPESPVWPGEAAQGFPGGQAQQAPQFPGGEETDTEITIPRGQPYNG